MAPLRSRRAESRALRPRLCAELRGWLCGGFYEGSVYSYSIGIRSQSSTHGTRRVAVPRRAVVSRTRDLNLGDNVQGVVGIAAVCLANMPDFTAGQRDFLAACLRAFNLCVKLV